MIKSFVTEASASSNYLRISPLKLRRVLSQLTYCSYEYSIAVLNFLPNRSCSLIKKCLNSAVFNLRSNNNVDLSSVYIKKAIVNIGPTIKRFRPRAQGRAFSIKKRISHIISLL